MPSRRAYKRLRELIIENIDIDRRTYKVGFLTEDLIKKHGNELVELGLINSKDGIDSYFTLKSKVKRQLENLVKEGKVEKKYILNYGGTVNISHREAIYLKRG